MKSSPIYEAFPAGLQKCLTEIQQGTNLNGDFLLGSVLYAASTAIGNTHKLRVLEGWEVSCNLYMVIVGKTGMSKSPAINTALAPLNNKNRLLAKQHLSEIASYESSSKEERASSSTPIRKQVMIEDATLEAIYRILDNNHRGVGLCYDEIIGFFNNLSRYSNGSDQEQWLKLWSGSALNVNRVGTGSYFVSDPFVGFIGGIQPKVLPQLQKDNRDKNGFLERILFVYPDNVKKEKFPKQQASPAVFEQYNEIITRLLNLEMQEDNKAKVLDFNREALDYYSGFYDLLTDLINTSDESDPLLGFYPKMQSYCARFALILQLLYWTTGDDVRSEVGLRATKEATKICRHFLENAAKALDLKQDTKLSVDYKTTIANRMNTLGYSTRKIGEVLETSHTTVSKMLRE